MAVEFMSASRLRVLWGLLAVKVLARHQALSLFQGVRDLDGEPIQWSMIVLALDLRFAEVRRENAPEAAIAADERRRLYGSNTIGTQYIEFARAHKQVARRYVLNKYPHAPRERGSACGVIVAAYDTEKCQDFAGKSAAGSNCQAVGFFVESLQRTHVGVGYSDRDIDDPQQVCTDILGISQPLQDGVDLLSSCSVERLLEVCHRLRFRGPYRGNIVAAK
nr:hypothetical protein [Bradyrhizobium viridifuturi]